MKSESEKNYFLALDTSGMASGVYISKNQEILGQTVLYQKNIHSRRLSLSVTQLLDHLELELRDFKAIILSAGPGSFTGLRIGYSLAKGLAHALKLKMIEVPTLDIWAYQVGQSSLPILSFIDAHRDEIFFSRYQRNGEQLERIYDYQTVALTKLPDIITVKTLINGENLAVFQEKFQKVLGENAVFPAFSSKQAEGWALIALGYKKFSNGEFSHLENCEPLYLRSFKGVM